ncbi:dynein axonemal assembly factor 5 [Procambarus clarkii]|uniref:dynein axonemal assembly factor 5 n=1 Tax=Procambarus clarkii TaxID=6728 RepID=UPI001E6778D1|nr:dynein axonemal assembly factor 5-like [Procambarus clarkii]
MATEDAASGTCLDLHPILSEIQNATKAKRRKALELFYKITFESEEEVDKDRLSRIFGLSWTLLLARMSDESEISRINASNSVLKFIELRVVSEDHLVDIIPIVHHRLAVNPILEESEDVRKILIDIIKALTIRFESKLIPFMNDVVNILKRSVVDKSPDVRKAASECVSCYAKATNEKFNMQSKSLVEPLLKALCHQRFKNRIACINALGDLLLYGDSSAIQDVSCPLARCTMDLPQVRLSLVEVGGALALQMPDRYSYWHRILPLLLFGLRDDDAEVRQKSEELWMKVGLQFETENIEQLKTDVDFDVTLENYPAGEARPGVGCRVLVRRALYHILPGLMNDLDDWQAGSRLQAAKLLTVLILNADVGITQYAEKILMGLNLVASDKEENVVKQVIECSRYLGHFLPPKTYLPLIVPRLSMYENGECPLTILASLAEGTMSSQLQENITDIITAVSAEDVAYVSQDKHQRALLQLTHILITKCDPSESSFNIFRILLFIASSSEMDNNVNIALDQLDVLSNKTGCAETSELYRRHLNTTLKSLLASASCWSEHTPQFLMFAGLMELAGQSLGYEIELFVKVLVACVPKKQDPYVSLRCLTKLRTLLFREDKPLESSGHLGLWLPELVSDCIAVFLPWHAGATAEALRTAAVACLEAVFKIASTESRVIEELRKCLALIPALIEDDAEDTRRFSCDVIYWTVTNYFQLIDSEKFHMFANKLVKRFDDVSQLIRLKAAHVLEVLFNSLPENYDPRLHFGQLQDLYTDAVIFLDDTDDKLQEAVSVTLEKMGRACPELLITTLEKDIHKYRNAQNCHKLIDSMKALQVCEQK